MVERFALQGMRFGTDAQDAGASRSRATASRRRRSGRCASGAGSSTCRCCSSRPSTRSSQLVLNPTQLGTVKAAQGLVARTDSTRQALEQTFKALDVRGTVDSARALADRLAATDPKKLGLDSTRQAIQSVQATLKQLDQPPSSGSTAWNEREGRRRAARRRRQSLDEARKQDYAFARSLLKLPTVLGAGHRQRVLRQGQHRPVPAGALLGRAGPARTCRPGSCRGEDPGPKRLRASGATVRLSQGARVAAVPVAAGPGGLRPSATGCSRATTRRRCRASPRRRRSMAKPMIVRRPAHAPGLGHRRARRRRDRGSPHVAALRDSVSARLRGVKLPSFDIPGLPFRLAPGHRRGEPDVRASRRPAVWAAGPIGTNEVAWARDTRRRRRRPATSSSWSGGCSRAEAARRDGAAERDVQGAETRRSEQPGPGDRPAAQGGGRRGGGARPRRWRGPRWTAWWPTRSSR